LKQVEGGSLIRFSLVPPGFIAGSGLKQGIPEIAISRGIVPPGFIAGSGLKLELPAVVLECPGSSRLHRRERIETMPRRPR